MSEDVAFDIFSAANIGDEDVVRAILEKNGEKVHEFNQKGWNALMYACYSGHHKTVSYLLTQGANPIPVFNGSNVNLLCLAAKCSNDNVLRILLNYSERLKLEFLNLPSPKTGATPLFCTAHFGYHTAAIELLRAGAKTEIINERCYGRTPLLQACANGHELVVQTLLKFNADCDAIDTNGDTVYSLAVAKDYYKIVDVLDTYAAKNLTKRMGQVQIKRTQSWGEKVATKPISIATAPSEFSKISVQKPKKVKQPQKSCALPSLEVALRGSDLGKYYQNFLDRNCDMTIFLTLTEHELKTVYDIKLFGPRRKISLLIKDLRAKYL